MPEVPHVANVSHTIQLAVAPVFLLTALGTILAVLSTRLGRIIDRARVLVDRLPKLDTRERAPLIEELKLLGRRRKLVNLAIIFATCAALLVCVLIAAAFVGSIFEAEVSRVVAGLFVASMTAFIAALVFFLREILLAVASTRMIASEWIEPQHD